jgi:hypothetical protein
MEKIDYPGCVKKKLYLYQTDNSCRITGYQEMQVKF